MSRWAKTGSSVLLGVVLGAGSMLVGLAQAGRLRPEQPEVLVALAQDVEVVHRKVDLLLESGEVQAAIEELEAARSRRWPTSREGGEAAVQLRHDVYGRLLDLRLEHPEVDSTPPEALLDVAREGLGDDVDELDANPFTARLIAVQGQLHERLDQDDRALDSYERALEMNRVLLDRVLGEDAP